MRTVTDLQLHFAKELSTLVGAEHHHQIDKWGVQKATPAEWVTWLTEEVGEVASAVSEYEYKRGGTCMNVVHNAIQAATLALKIAEIYLYSPKTLGDGNG